MSAVDLYGELLAYQQAITADERERLQPHPDALLWGWVGATSALVERDRWQPYTLGRRVIAVPVRVADPSSPQCHDPEGALRFGELVDLVAFPIDRPERWALRTGAALWLGAIRPQLFMPDPVTVHPHPLSWLRNPEGLCPLTRSARELQSLLLPCDAITVADVHHGKRLERALSRPYAIPQILVRQAARAKAA